MNVTARRASISKVTVKRAKGVLRFGVELDFTLEPDDPLRAFLSRSTGTRSEMLLPPPPIDGVAADGDAEDAQAERRALWEREVEIKAQRPAVWSQGMSARIWALDDETAAEDVDLDPTDLDEPDIRLAAADVDRRMKFFLLGAFCTARLTVTSPAALLSELTVARLSEIADRRVAFELVGRQLGLGLDERSGMH